MISKFQKISKRIIPMVFILLIMNPLIAQDKLAQTGFQFLSVSPDGRGSALGDAMTTLEMGSSSLFFNPAGMARMNGMIDISATQNNWIADITHNAFSLAIKPAGGRYGVFGVTYRSVDYGKIQGTMVWGNEAGYIDTEIFKPTAYSAGLGYAKTLTDKFSVGGQIKYTGQQLGKSVVPVGEDSLKTKRNVTQATAFDFGTIYKTGFKSLAFGMSVRNFSQEIKFEKEDFQLPLTFCIGISFDLLDLVNGFENQGLLMSVDAVHPRSHPEQLKLGFEYNLASMFFVRAGYISNSDEDNLTYGFGLRQFGLAVDYAYTPFGVFDNVQRFTLRFSL